MAKILKQNGINVGQNRLYAWLRKNKYLGSSKGRSDYNLPTQKSMNLGIFEVEESSYKSNGAYYATFTAKVTGKGQIYFINKFLKMKEAI